MVLIREKVYILLPSPIPSHSSLVKVVLHTPVLGVDSLFACPSLVIPLSRFWWLPTPRPSAAPDTETPFEPDLTVHFSRLHLSSTFHSSLLLVYILQSVDFVCYSRVTPHSPPKCPSTPAGRSPSLCAPSKPSSSILQSVSRPINPPSTMPTAQTRTSLLARPSDCGLCASPPGCGKQGCSLGIASCCSRGTVCFARLCCWGL